MYASKDGGKSFKFDNSADDIPGNLYQVLLETFLPSYMIITSSLRTPRAYILRVRPACTSRITSMHHRSLCYQVKFANNNGFVLGSDGVLLRYSGQV